MESSTSLFIFLVIFIANDKNREKVLVSSYSYQFADVNTYLLYVLSICVLRSENSIGFPAFQINYLKKQTFRDATQLFVEFCVDSDQRSPCFERVLL